MSQRTRFESFQELVKIKYDVILNPRQEMIAKLFLAEGKSGDRMVLLAKLLYYHPHPELDLKKLQEEIENVTKD